jgi:hypothetical protein
MVEEHSKK